MGMCVCEGEKGREDDKKGKHKRSAARLMLDHLCAKETSFEWKKEKLKRVNYIGRVLRNLYNKNTLFPPFPKDFGTQSE